MNWLALAVCGLVACGDNGSVDCVEPLDAPWLSGLVASAVVDLAQAPRATASDRTAARSYLSDQLTAIGLQPMQQAYPTGANVYATIPSTIATTKEIIVGAHFDTVANSPGADDNATGVAAVLAVARYVHETTCRNATVTVVLFDEEEPGLFGSRAFAEALVVRSAEGGAREVIAVHTIDQLGWDSDGDHRFEIEMPTPAIEAEYRVAALAAGVPLTTTASVGTDHESFRSAGFPAVGVTEEYVEGDTSPYRHTANDTAETVDQSYLVLGAKLVARVVLTELTQ